MDDDLQALLDSMTDREWEKLVTEDEAGLRMYLATKIYERETSWPVAEGKARRWIDAKTGKERIRIFDGTERPDCCSGS
jgi:hypothetical protein